MLLNHHSDALFSQISRSINDRTKLVGNGEITPHPVIVLRLGVTVTIKVFRIAIDPDSLEEGVHGIFVNF